MANFVNELNSLNFAAYIGGPIQAAVDAQNSASRILPLILIIYMFN